PLLFSYGTLQHLSVQLTTFGRALQGSRDELVGYELSTVNVADPDFVAATGKEVHANVVSSDKAESRVPGMVFEGTDTELARCDEYERPARYGRVTGQLSSGRTAWVYVYTPPV